VERYFKSLNMAKRKLLGLQNVVGVGVGHKQVRGEDTGRPAYIVYVEKKIQPRDLARGHVLPQQIEGLDVDVVEIGVVKMLGGNDVRTRRERPCQPGLSVGHFQTTAGTLGALVKDKKTGELMVLSNNHVLANGSTMQTIRAKKGDPILQPGPYDGGTIKDRIGVLHRYVPLVKDEAKSDCPVASAVAMSGTRILKLFKKDYELRFYKHFSAENIVDCALCKLDSPEVAIADVFEIGAVAGVAEAGPGLKVQKSGRTSGLTEGTVKSVGTTLQVEMSKEEKLWFADQVVTDLPSKPGDSGSLILTGDRKAVGLLFAGSDKMTVFNRIANVMERLEIEFN